MWNPPRIEDVNFEKHIEPFFKLQPINDELPMYVVNVYAFMREVTRKSFQIHIFILFIFQKRQINVKVLNCKKFVIYF